MGKPRRTLEQLRKQPRAGCHPKGTQSVCLPLGPNYPRLKYTQVKQSMSIVISLAKHSQFALEEVASICAKRVFGSIPTMRVILVVLSTE